MVGDSVVVCNEILSVTDRKNTRKKTASANVTSTVSINSDYKKIRYKKFLCFVHFLLVVI